MTTAVAKPVHVEIWSDPQCVWCFIAHPRFEKAVAAFDGEVEVTYRSFELRPDAPIEIDKEQQIARHAGANRERIDAVNAQLSELARAEGVTYRPDLTRPTNSRLALELLHHADATGDRAALTHRLFAAYFTEGGISVTLRSSSASPKKLASTLTWSARYSPTADTRTQ